MGEDKPDKKDVQEIWMQTCSDGVINLNQCEQQCCKDQGEQK